MSLADIPLAILDESISLKDIQSQTANIPQKTKSPSGSLKSNAAKCVFISGSSDSGKSSSDSPNLLNCSFDSGIAGVLRNGNDMQLHNRIQQCQCILLALERDEEYFSLIRNRLSKITKSKQKQSTENEFFCNVCCAEIDPSDEKTYVKCYICKKCICRNVKCSNWLPKTAEWECELCQTSKESLAQTSSWVADQITFNQEKLIRPSRARSEIYIPISEYNDSVTHFESVSQVGANSTAITAEQKFKIREYVEQIVAKLLGGNLDTIAVNQLSKSENCLPASKIEKIHNGTSSGSTAVRSNTNDFSDISETRLRQMIQKIIAETVNLPSLTNGHATSEIALNGTSRTSDKISLQNNAYNQRHRTEHYFEPTIYQDLLATAVLNKIVDKQLNKNRNVADGNDSGDCDILDDNKKFTSSDQNFNIEKLSTSSGSSVEPRSDCSYPEEEQILNNNDEKSSDLLRNSDRDSVISDYLANHMIPLPDLSAMAESEDDDHTSVTSSAVADGTWEKNWLFKKKKSTLSSSVTASSVGMLVPDPKEDVRAQIGDKTADEVSDLSELGSDSDDSLNSLRSHLEPVNDRLFNKHLIGGQNSKMILDELIERSSMISNSTLPNAEDPLYIDVCNEHIITTITKTEGINNNVNQQNCTSAEHQAKDIKSVLCSTEPEDINSNSLKDQISYDSNPCYNSGTSTVEEYIENDNNQKGFLAFNFNNNNNKSITNTALTSNTNMSTETSSKSINNATKQSVTNMSGYVRTNPSNQRHPNNLIISAVQNKEFPSKNTRTSTRQFRGELRKNDQNKVKSFKNRKDSDDIYINVDVDDHDYAVNKDEHNDVGVDDEHDDDDDVVAIFRHFVPGSIAEREYKKWYNAVEMPNNPYAPEALKRRISGSQERFIDLPNISPTKDLNPLDLLNEPKLHADENKQLENDYKRYSRDYYINSSLISQQASPAKDVSPPATKETRESTMKTPSSVEKETKSDLYKAIPAHVIEINSSPMEAMSTMSKEGQINLTSISDDSDTLKQHDTTTPVMKADTSLSKRRSETADELDGEERPCSLVIDRSENNVNAITPTRGSTPVAFKFLQPKRKLLKPNQILAVDGEGPETSTSPIEKPVIEAEVVKALPSVKALAKAFLLTSTTKESEKLWLRKTKTLSQSGKKRPVSPKRSADQYMPLDLLKPEDDVTITSDLSSLETDSSSVGIEIATTSNLTTPPASSTNNPSSHMEAGNLSPVLVRQGVLKNNIAFFENLKNK